MAVPIIPILKKVAVALLGDKRTWKVIGGIVLLVLIIILLPLFALLGVMKSDGEYNVDNYITSLIAEREAERAVIIQELEDEMSESGFSEEQTAKARTLYLFVLYDEDGDVVERLVGCFAEEQTDEQLITAVNEEFETTIDYAEWTMLMEGMSADPQKGEEEIE